MLLIAVVPGVTRFPPPPEARPPPETLNAPAIVMSPAVLRVRLPPVMSSRGRLPLSTSSTPPDNRICPVPVKFAADCSVVVDPAVLNRRPAPMLIVPFCVNPLVVTRLPPFRSIVAPARFVNGLFGLYSTAPLNSISPLFTIAAPPLVPHGVESDVVSVIVPWLV
ncbi:MAG: hypothetical protein IPK29_03790 [Betaproteobacteria bacterium]|nr:hypothetical protein [Betaproteobacteria bacterium]